MLLDLGSWWQSIAFFNKIFWVIALLFSGLFLLQSVVSLFGGGVDDVSGDADDYVGDDDGIGYQFFTVKNMIAFFTLFGWAGLAAHGSGAAQAEAEKIREKAKGEADAIYAKLEAEARGMYEILTKQAEGLDRIVKAAGNNPKDAVLLLISDKLPELVKMQTDAIKNIKIDKVTVWENGQQGNGKSSTANFVSGLYKAVPPLKDIFDMAGMDLPSYLGQGKNNDELVVKE